MEKQYGEEVLEKIDSSNMENQHDKEGVMKKIDSSSIENQPDEEGLIDSSSSENQLDEEGVLKKIDSSSTENQPDEEGLIDSSSSENQLDEGGLKNINRSSTEKQHDEESLKKIDSSSMEMKNDEEGLEKIINRTTTSVEKQYGEPAESYARYWHDPIADDVRIDMHDTYIRPVMHEFFEEEIRGDRDNAGATRFEGENTGRTTIYMEPGESSQTRFEGENTGHISEGMTATDDSDEIREEARTTVETTITREETQDNNRTRGGEEHKSDDSDEIRQQGRTTVETTGTREEIETAGGGEEHAEAAIPISSRWTAKDWVDALGGLQTTSGYAIDLMVGFVVFGLFGEKALSDSSTCDPTTGLSVRVFIYTIVAVLCMTLPLFAIPTITVDIRGLVQQHLEERRSKIMRSYIIITLVLMIGLVFVYLAIFYFVQARVGPWSCLSTTGHLVLLSVGLALCFLEYLYLRSLYSVSKA